MTSVMYAQYRKLAVYAECRYAECRYAECRDAIIDLSLIKVSC
jgi:hypothetical protein